MKTKGLWVIVSIALILGLLIGSFGCPSPATPTTTVPTTTAPTTTAEPIKLGVLTDYTGSNASSGPKYDIPRDLYMQKVGYNFAGRPVQLVVEDTASASDKALEKAKKLVELDKVHMLIGTVLGTISVPIGAYAADVKIPDIIGYAGHPEAVSLGWAWSTIPTLETISSVSGLYALNKGYKTATTIGADYVAGYKIVGGAMQKFVDGGGEIIQSQWVPLGTKDFAPYLSAMKEADVLFMWLIGPDIINFLAQYEDFGLIDKMPIIITLGDTLWDELLSGVSTEYAGHVSGATTYTWDVDNALNNEFVAAFRDATGSNVGPDAYDQAFYEDFILANAVFEATNGDTDPESIRNAILGIQIETPAGTVRIDRNTGYAYRSQMYIMELGLDSNGQLSRKRVQSFPEQEIIQLRPEFLPQ